MTVMPYFAAGVAHGGLNLGLVVQEGDSITAWEGGYADQFAAANPSYTFHNLAVGGSGVDTMLARRPAALAYAPEFLSVFIGANGLPGATALDYCNSVYNYIAPFKAMGTKVVICTVIASTTLDDTRREEVNAQFKADMGTQFDALCDWDATAMGVAANASDTTYFLDGTHPTTLGHTLMVPNYRGAMHAIMGITREVEQFTFDPVNDVSLSTVTTSNAVLIGGLNYLETKPISVEGGEYQKNGGSWTSSSGTVVNGDMVDVRGTSSSSYSTITSVVLTIGSINASFDIDTVTSLTNATWAPNLSPPAQVSLGFTVSSYDFTGVNFNAGLGVVFVNMQTRQCMSCDLKDGGGSLVSAGTLVVTTNPTGSGISLWQFNVPTDGSYTVHIVGSAALANLDIFTGTITTTNTTANDSIALVTGFVTDPHTAGSQLDVLSGGIGVAYVTGGTINGHIWNNGTEDFDNSTISCSVAHYTSSATPSVSASDGIYDFVCAAWGP